MMRNQLHGDFRKRRRKSSNNQQKYRLTLLTVTALFSSVFTLSGAQAFSTGLTGYSGKQGPTCANSGCHSGTNYNSQLRFDSATTVEPGSTNDMKLVLSFTPNPANVSHYAGLNVALSNNGGNLLSGSETRVVDAELVHNAPVQASNNSVTWNFSWTAPETAGDVTLYACSETVDRNGLNTGDESSPACITQNITVNTASTIPAPVANNESVSVDADYNGDMNGDILYRDEETNQWTMIQTNGTSVIDASVVPGMSTFHS